MLRLIFGKRNLTIHPVYLSRVIRESSQVKKMRRARWLDSLYARLQFFAELLVISPRRPSPTTPEGLSEVIEDYRAESLQRNYI